MPLPLKDYLNTHLDWGEFNGNYSAFCPLCDDYLSVQTEGGQVRNVVCKCLPGVIDTWITANQKPPPKPSSAELQEIETRQRANAPLPSPAPKPRLSPETFTAEELMAMDLPEPKWAIPGLLCQGLNILAGGQKLGKSWMAFAVAIAIALGGCVFGSIQVVEGDVLYLALEDNRRRLQDRLKKLLNGSSAPARLHLCTEWPNLGDGGLTLLRQWLEGHPQARLIIIDTLKKVRPARRGNGSAYDEDYDFMGAIKKLADEFDVCIVALHHVRKLAAEDVFDTVSGTIGLTGAADATLVLERQRGRNDALLHITGRDVEEKAADEAMALEWCPITGIWTLVGSAEEYQQSDNRKKVVEVMRLTGRPLTPKEISDMLNWNRGTVRSLLHRMVTAGQILGEGDKYHLKDLLQGGATPATGATGVPVDKDLWCNTTNGHHAEDDERGEWWR